MTATPSVPTLTTEDRLEILDLLHRYMFVLDGAENHENGYGYADLYTEDGTFGSREPGRESLATAAGRTPEGGIRSSGQRGAENVLHLNVGEVIVPTAEGARGVSYLFMMDGPANQLYFAGWYEDEYVKTDKGWRFKSRVHVAGERAGIPAYAGALRREVQRSALEHLDLGDTASEPAAEIARDPLRWVDGQEDR